MSSFKVILNFHQTDKHHSIGFCAGNKRCIVDAFNLDANVDPLELMRFVKESSQDWTEDGCGVYDVINIPEEIAIRVLNAAIEVMVEETNAQN